MRIYFIIVIATLTLLAHSGWAEQRVFWSSPHDGNEGIFSAKLDGTDIVRVIDLRSPNTILGLFRRPGAIAIDDLNGRLYFADSTNNDIISTDLQGGNPLLIVDEGVVAITDVDVDPVTRTVYYTTDTGYVGRKRVGFPADQTFPSSFSGVAVAPSSNSRRLYMGRTDGVRYFDLANFAGGVFYLTNTTYPVSRIEHMHTADQLAFYNSLDDQLMVRQFGAPSDIVLLQFPDNLYAPDFMAFDRNESTLFWTSSSNDKIYLAPLAIFTLPDPPTEFITASSPLGIAISCGKFAPDPDGDGTPSCDETCPNDVAKVAPGICGCGLADTDSDGDGTANCIDQCPNDPSKVSPGACGCGAPEGTCPTPTPTPLPTTPPTLTPESPSEPTIRELAPGLKITEPPVVVISGKSVTLVFEKFLKTTLKKPGKKAKSALLLEAKKPKITSRYSVTVSNTSTKTKDVRTLSTKKNQLTLKNLKPGSYTVSYRAEILKDGKVAAKTNVSPSAVFTIS